MEIVKFGDVGISRVVELEGPMMAPSELFPDVGSEDLALHRDWLSPRFLDPDDILILSVHTDVVRTRRHTILVDTGVGRGKDQETESRYLRGLLDAGVSPEKVDFVVNTHFHIDHVGWNTRPTGRMPCGPPHLGTVQTRYESALIPSVDAVRALEEDA